MGWHVEDACVILDLAGMADGVSCCRWASVILNIRDQLLLTTARTHTSHVQWLILFFVLMRRPQLQTPLRDVVEHVQLLHPHVHERMREGGMASGCYNVCLERNRWHLIGHVQMIEPNYPENLGLCIIINAPWWVKARLHGSLLTRTPPRYIQGIWSVVQMFLQERTRAKFRLYGYDYKDELAKVL